MANPKPIKRDVEAENLQHHHYPEMEIVDIDQTWDYNQKQYFESVNQLKQLQDIEDNLVEALVLNRRAMFKANESRLAFSRTSMEPDDFINERKISLNGVNRDGLFEELSFENWFHEQMKQGDSNDEL